MNNKIKKIIILGGMLLSGILFVLGFTNADAEITIKKRITGRK